MDRAKDRKSKPLIYAGFFIALGVLLPLPFHMIGIGGTIFLPMHIPVLLSGFDLGGFSGLMTGVLTPLINHLITGMPPLAPIPMAVIMMFELGAYGLLAGVVFQKTSSIWGALISSMVGGRIVAGLTVWVLILAFGFEQLDYPLAFVGGAVFTGLPGIALHLFVIPLLTSRLNQS